MLDCLKGAGTFDATIVTLAGAVEHRSAIQISPSMPENVKANLLASEFKPERVEPAHDTENDEAASRATAMSHYALEEIGARYSLLGLVWRTLQSLWSKSMRRSAKFSRLAL